MSDAMIAAVRRGWAEANAVVSGGRTWRAVRISVPGPVSVLAGIKENDGAQAILFETPIEHAPAARGRFEADGIAMLEERSFADRAYRVAVSLERPDLENIFCIVVADLIEAAGRQPAPPAAVAALFTRLSAWQAFLKARRSGLSREAVIGLIGELLLARRLAAASGYPAAIEAWKGPTGGLHDFLRNGHAIEVKTTAGVTSLIEVTSLDQLEDTGLSALLLAHVQLVESPGGLTLPAVIKTFREDLLRIAPAAVSTFSDAILAAGYADVDADLYAHWAFQPLGMKFFKVAHDFPRLTHATVAHGIADARYRLELRALQPFLSDENTVAEMMTKMGDIP